jgi:hypothetical protein
VIEQSSLGTKKMNRLPKYSSYTIARVTSVADYHKYARIEVLFLDYSQPCPVWVIGELDREPVEGDQVLIGFIEGRQDMPYVKGFVKNKSYTTNFVVVKKDKIKLQLPIFEIGVKDGMAEKDVESNLLDNTKQSERAYIELTEDHVFVSFPTSKDGSTAPATIEITATGMTIDHPSGAIHHHGGSKGVARVGDTVTVNVNGTNYTGTITSGSTKTFID